MRLSGRLARFDFLDPPPRSLPLYGFRDHQSDRVPVALVLRSDEAHCVVIRRAAREPRTAPTMVPASSTTSATQIKTSPGTAGIIVSAKAARTTFTTVLQRTGIIAARCPAFQAASEAKREGIRNPTGT